MPCSCPPLRQPGHRLRSRWCRARRPGGGSRCSAAPIRAVPGPADQVGSCCRPDVSVSTLPIHDATCTSYVAVWTKASQASARRSAMVKPLAGHGGQHVGVLVRRGHDRHRRVVPAAARTIDGPPMSICSTHSSARGPRHHRVGEGVEVGGPPGRTAPPRARPAAARGTRAAGRRGCRRARGDGASRPGRRALGTR